MPAEGVEPTLPFGNKILSLARLPISPRRLLESRKVGAPGPDCKPANKPLKQLQFTVDSERSILISASFGAWRAASVTFPVAVSSLPFLREAILALSLALKCTHR
jgi:hypothetical protein